MLNKISLLLIFFTITVIYGKAASYYVINDAYTYEIFDKYDQPLDILGYNKILTGAPLRIIEDHSLRGDGFSYGTRVSYLKNRYIIAQDESGNFLGKNDKKRIKIHNCKVVNDTITITKDKVVSLLDPFSLIKISYFKKGERLVRIFLSANKYYVTTLGVDRKFGWCNLSCSGWKTGGQLSIVKENSLLMSVELQKRISKIFSNANEKYMRYFELFNTVTNDMRSVPRWKVTTGAHEMACHLSVPHGFANQLAGSTEYLFREVDNLLFGKYFNVERGHDFIRIIMRDGE